MTLTHSTSSRQRREDLTVQVELSTVVASDYACGASKANPLANDDKVCGVKPCQEVVGLGGAADDDQVLSPAMDKAERGALADSGTDEPPLDPPRPTIAFELTSPLTPFTRGMQRRRDEMAQEQADEDEFMRII